MQTWDKQNRLLIAQTPGLTFQTYPNIFVIPALVFIPPILLSLQSKNRVCMFLWINFFFFI